MFEIKKDFLGANIEVVSVEGTTVNIKVELRGTTEDWFYWCFKVVGAAGMTLKFMFENDIRIGYYGPAISRDYKTWHFQNEEGGLQGGSFTYTFGEDENEVYFAHDILYRPERFFGFAKENKLNPAFKVLCRTKKGHDVPYFTLGSGDRSIVLTARHHACESTGSYVLEGVIAGLLEKPIPNMEVFCVPMVDFDGVLYGDQGKARAPHDHNRDYPYEGSLECTPVYTETAAIRKYISEHNIVGGFDFHSPWHIGGENDKLFFVERDFGKLDRVRNFEKLFLESLIEGAMKYDPKDNHAPNTTWSNDLSPNFSSYIMAVCPEAIGFSLETAYFGDRDNIFSPEKAYLTGKSFAEAIRKYFA